MILIDPSKLDGCKLYTTDQFPRDRRVEGWNDCIEYLQKCCTHVPVVEVVRCLECKYVHEAHYEEPGEPPYIKYTCGCKYGLAKPYTVDKYDFCSRGEKMDAEVEG